MRARTVANPALLRKKRQPTVQAANGPAPPAVAKDKLLAVFLNRTEPVLPARAPASFNGSRPPFIGPHFNVIIIKCKISGKIYLNHFLS